ncbi:MAG: zinc dependent phospholipase C family protein, partial [Bacteroidaceae bacterium]|nr:zinc dependent phospholipase C family protein [Bacteroidaceae bacterium]
TYVKNETDAKKWSFYIGYWIHLYTDVLWHRLVYMPLLQQ